MGEVLHASGSGYFPTCIQEASSPDHCPWTLEKAMETYWRVRTWTFEASGLVGEAGDPGPIFPFSTTIENITSGNEEEQVDYTSEEQLVCFNSFRYEDSESRSVILFDNPEKSDDLYTSGIYGLLEDTGTEKSGFNYEFRVYPEYPPLEPGVNNSGTITALGATLPLLVYQFDPEVTLDFADVTATLTPTLWWSYGETYNTSTGEPS
jgi:hypothetical protein